jgi:hypothetical protein
MSASKNTPQLRPELTTAFSADGKAIFATATKFACVPRIRANKLD